MPKTIMNRTAVLSVIISVFSAVLFSVFQEKIYLTLAITFSVTAYHLLMRFIVGWLYNTFMKNHADVTKSWYQVHAWEEKLYDFLKVKRWKNKMPVYYPETFSRKRHTWDEIAQAMCQSELVHETNMILSFLPIIASIWFDSFWVFFITSLCSALFDLLFVMMQRFNRPRILKIIQRSERRICHDKQS